MKYNRIPTTYAIYRAILDEHCKLKELNNRTIGVFESYTNIVEDGPCTIYTVWGLNGADCPLVGARTTYEMDWEREVEGTRQHEYWLCAPVCECEE